ncbi:zinc transporter ZIP6-like isoform X2 [Tachypleus tridentatus]|uniref:zinc transporter ZIP6-like isoform X2 n=1 Tax=Tachypleus tridentatus TaxID=6853 RepID=UPI003FD136AF
MLSVGDEKTVFLLTSCLLSQVFITEGHRDHKFSNTSPQENILKENGSVTIDHNVFLKQIFHKYGNNGAIALEGFERLLESLGIGEIAIHHRNMALKREESLTFDNEHRNHYHNEHTIKNPTKLKQIKTVEKRNKYENTASGANFKASLRDLQMISKSQSVTDDERYVTGGRKIERKGKLEQDERQKVKKNVSSLNSVENGNNHVDRVAKVDKYPHKCLTAMDILFYFDFNLKDNVITPKDFLHLCPAIIYELEQHQCEDVGDYHSNNHEEIDKSSSRSSYVWAYSSAAVIVISLCGLVSVAIVPVMQLLFYQTLLQFLVGLAIGSLSGDALLHLLPHAMAVGEHHRHGNENPEETEVGHIWQGLVALAGICSLFLVERALHLLTSYQSRRKNKCKERNIHKRIKSGCVQNVGEKLSHYQQNGTVLEDKDFEVLQKLRNSSGEQDDCENIADVPEDSCTFCSNSVIRSGLVGVRNTTDVSLNEQCHRGTVYHHEGDGNYYVITVADHQQPQVKRHGHSHEVPTSVSAVAWMVIMGDGFHNFCDGLAIGAAFASGTSGGLSTTIAVFCHELPHELGDFAMLLKAGMTVKQALLYNGLSSILCFLGMVIGVTLGNVSSANEWIFAGAAGMFLYIALVDMVPELESSLSHLLGIQLLGISVGISVMLVISVYEHNIQLSVG